MVHLESAPIHHFLHRGFPLTRIIPVIVQVVIDLVAELVALFEALVVGADQHDAQVELLEADVDVKHVLFGAAWDADGCPGLAVGHR